MWCLLFVLYLVCPKLFPFYYFTLVYLIYSNLSCLANCFNLLYLYQIGSSGQVINFCCISRLSDYPALQNSLVVSHCWSTVSVNLSNGLDWFCEPKTRGNLQKSDTASRTGQSEDISSSPVQSSWQLVNVEVPFWVRIHIFQHIHLNC